MSFEYDAEAYSRTRLVEVFKTDDGTWRWRRSRLGGGDVALSISPGYDDPKRAYRSAVKENYPLEVKVPDGFPIPKDELDSEPITSDPEPPDTAATTGD